MEIRKIRRGYLAILISVTLLLVGAFIFFLVYPFNDDIKYTVSIVILIVLVGFGLWIKPRIDIVNMHLAYQKLYNLAKPQKISVKAPFDDLKARLVQNEYTLEYNDDKLSLFYKIDINTKGASRRGILMAFVIYKEDISFENKYLEKAINHLENTARDRKDKFIHYGIMQIKAGTHDEKSIKDAYQTRFDRVQMRHIVLINALVDKNGNTAMLFSEDYSPTIFYKHVGNEMIKLIK